MSIKPPEFLTDLYRDFRDRSLVLPAGLLIAALIAVPVLMRQSPTPVPSVPQTDGIEATAATPAVLAERTGVRNYRKRLRELKQKNPFTQQFALPSLAKIEEIDIGELEVSELDDGGDDSAGGDGGTADSGGVKPAADSDADSEDDGEDAEAEEQTKSSAEPEPTEERWFAWEVDIVFGPLRETERFEGVRALEFLPSRRKPVAVAAGVGTRGNRAGFIFLGEASADEGDGKCLPSPQDCSLLILEQGQARRVTIAASDEGEEDVTYRLELLDIVGAELEPGGE